MSTKHTVQDVIDAEYTLEPLVCVHCGDKEEVTFHQNVGDAYCETCGNWQLAIGEINS